MISNNILMEDHMTGTPVAHLIVDALKNEHPRALHITELAHITGINTASVSGSLNNRLEGDHGDVERVSRGVWKFVPPTKPKGKSLRPATSSADIDAALKRHHDAEAAANNRPRTLKVVGTTSQGLIAVDPVTSQSYIATKM